MKKGHKKWQISQKSNKLVEEDKVVKMNEKKVKKKEKLMRKSKK